MTATASLYEGYLDYKGPKDKHFKSSFAQLLPKQLLLKETITSTEPKSVYIQPGKYGEGRTSDKKKIYEFYMDGLTGRHSFKVGVMSQRKAWLEYFKIADEQVDIGVYDQVTMHGQLKQPGYGNVDAYGTHKPTPVTYNTLPATAMASPQHYATHASPSPLLHASQQNYSTHDKSRMKSPVHTMPSNKMKGEASLRIEDVPPPLPAGREDVPPPLPPGREDHPPPLPPGREDVPPPLPPGRDDVPPPLPPGREEFSPPLPPGREEFSPPLPPGREDVPPPLPPGRSDEDPSNSASVSNRIKQQGFGFPISPHDLQKIHGSGSDSRWKGQQLNKRDSGNVSGDGTIFHDRKIHQVIKVTSRSAPSSCEGQFGARSNKDEGYPTSTDSTPNHSGGATFTRSSKEHLQFKWCVEGVSRDKAEELVKSEQDGTMLYRINGEKHVITIKRSDKIYHHLVTRQDDKFIFRGLDGVTGTSVYNIVSNYLDHCKGRVIPYGGSIDAKKEGHEEYDKPWNPPDVKILVSQVAKELEKKKIAAQDSSSGTGGRRHSTGHKNPPPKMKSASPVRKSSSSGRPIRPPIMEDEQTDYVNDGEDVIDDEIYENTEPEQVYLNTTSRDSIYQNTPDITKPNIDNTAAYTNIDPHQSSASRTKFPKATPRIAGGQEYINAAAERIQDVNYSPSNPYLKLRPNEPDIYEPEEVYEPMDH